MTVQSGDCVYMWDLFPTQKLSSQPHLFLFSCHFSALASMLCPPEWEGKECIVQIACKYACVGVIMRLFDAKKIMHC